MNVACAEKFAMKRLLFVTAMMILTVAAVSGCRGVGCGRWFNRGAECETYAPACTDACQPDCDPLYVPGAIPTAPMGTITTVPSTVPPTMEALPQN
jgi:hypothetical protein